MFNLNYSLINFTYPWEKLTFQKRFSQLNLSKRKIAYFYETPDNSTFRYRVYNMTEVINNSIPGYSASFFCNDDFDDMQKVIECIDILILCRVKYTNKINLLITSAKSHNIKVIFDVDDLIFDNSLVHLILNTLAQDLDNPHVWDFWFAIISRIGATLRLCDYALTTNNFLANKIKEFSQLETFVIPNFINEDQLQISNSIFEQKTALNFARNEFFHIGYFSGSPTHNKDFEILTPHLIKIFKCFPQVKLLIAGFINLSNEFTPYMSRIEFIPFQDYVNLQNYIGLVELNVAPLQNNIFTNCKSELKYFEASICGTLTIASNTHVFNRIIDNKVNGFTSQEFEWHDKIVYIINNMHTYPSIVDASRKDVIANYAWYNQKEKILDFLKISNA